MNNISPEEFINRTNGKAYDVDGVAGVQCVDGIKEFTQIVYGKHDFNCGSCGYAYGLWKNFATNGVSKYFKKVSFQNAQKGDWIIWNWKSKPCPYSHVGMLVEKKGNVVSTYGQNQLTNTTSRAFNTRDISTSGILGVLRPLIYSDKIQPIFTTGVYKLIYSKYLRTTPTVASNNYVLVGNTSQTMRSGLTSTNIYAKAKVKAGISLTVKEVVKDNQNRTWGKTPNGYICICNADGTIQVQKQ